jgi:hypothetical protein
MNWFNTHLLKLYNPIKNENIDVSIWLGVILAKSAKVGKINITIVTNSSIQLQIMIMYKSGMPRVKFNLDA